MKGLSQPELLTLANVKTKVGDLVVCQQGGGFPFEPKRVFYLYDIPAGESRGAHAHKTCHQLLVAVAGSFTVELFDGSNHNSYQLNQPTKGLHIPPGYWASEVNFSGGAICLVLASHEYDESDYIRRLDEYLTWSKSNNEV